jgi:teichuronic acid exporter
MHKIGKGIVHGFFWTTDGQTFIIGFNLITNIILARMLGPEEFGIIGIILFFTTLAYVFVRGGLAGALIRLPEATDSDLKTVFTFNLSVSVVCYVLLVVFSPAISSFYNEPRIKNVLIVAGLILFINAFQLVNNTLLIREMRFKQRSLYQLISAILSSILAIGAAYFGLGIWSLIILQLGNQLFMTLQLALFEPFYMKVGWSTSSFIRLYKFGVNTTLSNLLNTAFNNIYQLVLGKYFSISQVGFFYQARKLEQVPNNVLNSFTQNVLFSGLAKLQNDIPQFIKTYNRVVRSLTALVGLMTVFTYLYGKEIILLLYGNKWLDAAFYLQLIIIASFFFMQENFNRVIFKVFDKTRQILILEIVKKLIHSLSIVLGVIYKDLEILLGGFVVTNIISFSINYYFSRRIIKDYNEIITLFKIIFTGVLSAILINLFNTILGLEGYFNFAGIPVLLIIYLGLLQLLKGFNFKNDLLSIKRTLNS